MDHLTIIQFLFIPFWAIGYFIAPISKQQVKYWTIAGCLIYLIYNIRFISSLSFIDGSFLLFDIAILQQMGLKLNFMMSPIRSLFLIFNSVSFLLVSISLLRSRKGAEKKFLVSNYLFYWFCSLTIVSGDIFTFFVFLEISFLPFIFLSIPDDFYEFRKKIGKFLVNQSFGAGFLLFGLLMIGATIYKQKGVLDFMSSGNFLEDDQIFGIQINNLVYLSFVTGFLIKAGSFPFHHGFFKSLRYFELPQRFMAQITLVSLSFFGVVVFLNNNLFQFNNLIPELFLYLSFFGMFFGISLCLKANSFYEFVLKSPLAIIPFIFTGTFMNDFIWSMGMSVYFFNYSLSIIGILYLLNFTKFSKLKMQISLNDKISSKGVVLIMLTLSCVASPLFGGFTGFLVIFSKLSSFSPYLGLLGLIFLALIVFGFIQKFHAIDNLDSSEDDLKWKGMDYLLFSIIFVLILGLGIFPKFLFSNFLKIPI